MNPAEFDKALKDFALALFHEDEEKHEEWVAVLRRLEQVGRSAVDHTTKGVAGPTKGIAGPTKGVCATFECTHPLRGKGGQRAYQGYKRRRRKNQTPG